MNPQMSPHAGGLNAAPGPCWLAHVRSSDGAGWYRAAGPIHVPEVERLGGILTFVTRCVAVRGFTVWPAEEMGRNPRCNPRCNARRRLSLLSVPAPSVGFAARL